MEYIRQSKSTYKRKYHWKFSFVILWIQTDKIILSLAENKYFDGDWEIYWFKLICFFLSVCSNAFFSVFGWEKS